MGWHVAGTARIAVVPPRSSEVVRFFEYLKRCVPSLLERDGHAEAGKSGTDDRHVQIGFVRVA